MQEIYVGHALLNTEDRSVVGAFVDIDGEEYYKIENYDRMRPFFMSIVSDSDHWMFISSSGGLTAGRKNPDHALFPYYTDDKIQDAKDLTGSKTLLLIRSQGKTFLWEPFSDRYAGMYAVQRNIYKNICGNKIRFEEINLDLGVTYQYTWCNSERFGFVKKSQIRNERPEAVTIQVLDGIQNILPYGVDRAMQSERSTLLDAYKKNELEAEIGLGIYSLSSLLVDKPEPAEALKATTVWSAGLDPSAYLLTSLQLDRFRTGRALHCEEDIRAERGAYFIHAVETFEAEASALWYIVAEVDQGVEDVVALSKWLKDPLSLQKHLETDVLDGTERLERIVASADGLQCTEDRMTTARHFANVLFNVMRGGIFEDQYRIRSNEFIGFVRHYNRQVADSSEDFFGSLPASLTIQELLSLADRRADPQLERLCFEYLPLTFSRRHGDPSRPWNSFSIETRNDDGSKKLSYEGNWRDIFQNWEALALSYPGFIESMICKFLNASTVDGYNPYRITRDGIDWEVLDPEDPWSYIGYWGDHQIIYLLKLLEIAVSHNPQTLHRWISKDIFSYANVPYRIKPYNELLEDPHNTILYDKGLEGTIAERVLEIGADGKLVWDEADHVLQVNLAEKLLITALAKLANLIPEGGIWMNTQRPEWNDANNALVGYGVSVVTLCYLRRYQHFMMRFFETIDVAYIEISQEVFEFYQAISEALIRFEPLLELPITDKIRKEILDALGKAAGDYTQRIYTEGFSGKKTRIWGEEIVELCDRSLVFIDHSIAANQRADKLFHAYNLMRLEGDSVVLSTLYEMLEGQVAVLSAGILSGEASLDVLEALQTSSMFRDDQNSYLLYPDRQLSRFIEKNNLSETQVEGSGLVQKMLANGDHRLVVSDPAGGYHFNGGFKNIESVSAALESLAGAGYADDVASDRAYLLNLFEELFNHHAYTGRSGTFYGYEGLGCIYWHMVSKLVLAIQESFLRLDRENDKPEVWKRLIDFYYRVQAGIGLNKTPVEYGAFPCDPYSHTPGNAGAQQPGMTGQVKEDIICRWGELGVCVVEGEIRIQPLLLRRSEFLSTPSTFKYYSTYGNLEQIELETGTLAFTYCQVPFIYRISGHECVRIHFESGEMQQVDGLIVPTTNASEIFSRSGKIRRIEIDLIPTTLYADSE